MLPVWFGVWFDPQNCLKSGLWEGRHNLMT